MDRFFHTEESRVGKQGPLKSSRSSSRVHSFNEYLNEYPEAGPLVDDDEYETYDQNENLIDEIDDESSQTSKTTKKDTNNQGGRLRLLSFDALGSIFSRKPRQTQNQQGQSAKDTEREDQKDSKDPYTDRDLSLLDYL
ncbi:hypothetical protein SPOG_00995 [Schizosaccharomyces cryophilus OY26]|uniref:Uncharacterized protein n=1 Tax=Schizosaccharomyces cryophilus (strain OY26 / ATCC MYA-4695 / CBS 11777 / NBRC 106824 / NRRL Y48691) TaxID=653667 RepID=S9VVM7_SCHCR|nr:uncharacterized protein SPOG_00995 [Schizosaccharomyces cryophilus OY26]EPY50234.1 hypothetical protein SPOG_00995 [Schizosaccharomyces cryophilus OY26]